MRTDQRHAKYAKAFLKGVIGQSRLDEQEVSGVIHPAIIITVEDDSRRIAVRPKDMNGMRIG